MDFAYGNLLINGGTSLPVLIIMTKGGCLWFMAKKFSVPWEQKNRPAVRSGCRAFWFPKGKIYFLVRYLRMSMAQAIRMTRPLMM